MIEVNTVASRSNTKKRIFLGVIATALLLIPRRSSRKNDTEISNQHNEKVDNDKQ